MQYQSDYIMRLIEQMGDLVRQALQTLRLGDSEASYDMAQQVIGMAVDLDPSIVARIAPQGLVALLEMNNLDDRVIEHLAEAFQLQAEALESMGELVEADVRRQQSRAVLGLIGPTHAN